MAHWKRLTSPDGSKVDVNMETVAYVQRYGETTSIVFVGGRSDEGNMQVMIVNETPDQIHMAPQLRSM